MYSISDHVCLLYSSMSDCRMPALGNICMSRVMPRWQMGVDDTVFPVQWKSITCACTSSSQGARGSSLNTIWPMTSSTVPSLPNPNIERS
jgi:hypothetical protein